MDEIKTNFCNSVSIIKVGDTDPDDGNRKCLWDVAFSSTMMQLIIQELFSIFIHMTTLSPAWM
jgi:hypothetical protein